MINKNEPVAWAQPWPRVGPDFGVRLHRVASADERIPGSQVVATPRNESHVSWSVMTMDWFEIRLKLRSRGFISYDQLFLGVVSFSHCCPLTIGGTENRTRDCWAGSSNASSVLCNLPHNNKFLFTKANRPIFNFTITRYPPQNSNSFWGSFVLTFQEKIHGFKKMEITRKSWNFELKPVCCFLHTSFSLGIQTLDAGMAVYHD